MGDVYPSCTPGTYAELRVMANKLCILNVEFPRAAQTAAMSVLTGCTAFKPQLERQIQLERIDLDVIFKRVKGHCWELWGALVSPGRTSQVQ